MIPDLPELSGKSLKSRFISPFPQRKEPLEDWARAGVDLLDGTQGLDKKNWHGFLEDEYICVEADGVPKTQLYRVGKGCEWISFSFDQNMFFCVAYQIGNMAFFYWNNVALHEYELIELGEAIHPTVRLDYVRDVGKGDSELILSYIKNGDLCIRVQRDRFTKEYNVNRNAGNVIVQCGFTTQNRFEWKTETVYPKNLPCPQSELDLVPRERRYISDIGDLRNLRSFQQEFQGTHNKISFVFTEEEVAEFKEWYYEVIIEGGAWFYADWPLLHTDKRIAHRFVGQPRYEWLFGANPGAQGRSNAGYGLGETPKAVPVYKVSATVEVYDRLCEKVVTSKIYPYYFGDYITSLSVVEKAHMPPRRVIADDITASQITLSGTLKRYIYSDYSFSDDITASQITISGTLKRYIYSTSEVSDDITASQITIIESYSNTTSRIFYDLSDDVTASQITILSGEIT